LTTFDLGSELLELIFTTSNPTFHTYELAIDRGAIWNLREIEVDWLDQTRASEEIAEFSQDSKQSDNAANAEKRENGLNGLGQLSEGFQPFRHSGSSDKDLISHIFRENAP